MTPAPRGLVGPASRTRCGGGGGGLIGVKESPEVYSRRTNVTSGRLAPTEFRIVSLVWTETTGLVFVFATKAREDLVETNTCFCCKYEQKIQS